MNEKTKTPLLGNFRDARRIGIAACLLLLSVLAALPTVRAQSVLSPIDSDATYMPQLAKQSVTTPPPTVFNDLTLTSPFKWNSVTLRPYVVYRYLYGDGIQPRPGVNTTTSLNSIGPGINLDLGQSWTINYNPTWMYYSNEEFRDSVDQFARLAGIIAYGDWGFQLSQDYADTSQPLVETGTQTDQKTFNSMGVVSYQMGSKVLLDLSLKHNIVQSEGFSDYRDTTAALGFRYQITPQFDAGVSVGVGHVKIDGGGDMDYTQPQVRLNWKPTGKFTLSVDAGMDYRSFDSGAADLENPILNASLAYQPVESTKLTIRAGRTVTPSYFNAELTENESWGAHLDQRLFQHFYLGIDYAHQDTNYESTVASAVSVRQDDTDTLNLRLSTAILKRATLAVFYTRSENESNLAGFGFTSEQTGVEFSYRY
jgi:hypothetical protein